MSDSHMIVKWNLRRLADDLARHLEILERDEGLWDRSLQTKEFLASYKLEPDDEHTVTMLAWGKQCVDCGDVRDYYMVWDYLWRDARLQPNQCCCRKCLSVRLGRLLEPQDFLMCACNTWMETKPEAAPEPIDADVQANIDKAFDGAPEGLKEAFEAWARGVQQRNE